MSNVTDLRPRQRIDPTHEWAPGPRECLPCFVRRMVDRASCTGTLVWAEHWKRERSPGASALIARLERQGAVCDCAVVSVLWSLSPELLHWAGAGELVAPAVGPACVGVRPRSTRPCGLWAAAAPVGD